MNKLTPTQVSSYQQQGYCIVPDFFQAADIALMRHELQRLRDDGLLQNKCTDQDEQTCTDEFINLQICPLTPHSDIFRSLAFYKPVGDTIGRLIKPPFQLQLDQIFVKPARHGYGTNWHQDNAYFHTARMRPEAGVGMWIAIDDAKLSNGTMQLIPGSHRQQAPHRRDLNSDHFITCADEVDETQAVPVVVPAGGVAFFNFGVVHCTRNNTSDSDRAGLALHFVEAAAVSDHHGNAKPHIRGVQASNGLREYGRDLSTDWLTAREQTTLEHAGSSSHV